MNRTELVETRCRLEEFVAPLVPLFGRRERRRWGGFYIQGLLLEGRRKTAAGMAVQYDGDVQALQQFVGQSPWDPMPIRQELAVRMTAAIGERPCAWIVDDTGFPKKGDHSVAVARQYSGTLGKVGNCQIAVSLNYATDEGAFPLDFQLYVPASWTDDAARRKEVGIPGEAVFRRNWEIGLEMMDRAISWGVRKGVVVADTAYGVVTDFRRNLRQRGLEDVVGVLGHTGVWEHPLPDRSGQVEMETPKTGGKALPRPKRVQDLAKSLAQDRWQEVTWRQGSKGPMSSRFAALRVQPSYGYGHGRGPSEPVEWLLVEWPIGEDEPTKYWLSNLAEEASLLELVRWAKMRWHVEQNYQQMKNELGLDHFEGRSWLGWHHHVTLTMIAFDFLLMEALRREGGASASAAGQETATGGIPAAAGLLSRVQTTAPRYLT